jgi:hypothetical protein
MSHSLTLLEKNMSTKALEKLWFHSKDEDGKINWQGQILEEVNDGVYLAQLYDWMLGQEGCMKLILVKDMSNWDFYQSSEDMREAGK